MKIRQILSICLVLAVASLSKADSEDVEYFAVFMEGKKVGHAIQSRVVADGKVTTSEKVSITISRANIPITIEMTETGVETADGKPLGFELIQKLAAMTMTLTGTINEQGIVNIITSSMGVEQKSTMQWPNDAMMAEGLRQLSVKKGLKQGTKYSAKIFSPTILQTLDIQIEIGPKQDIDLLGRVVALTKVKTTFSMPGAGEIVSTSYVDDELRLQKDITPIAGLQVEMMACAKEFALGENDVLELIDRMFIASPKPLDDVHSAKSISYLLSPIGETNGLAIPANDNQKIKHLKDNKIMVTVEPAAAPVRARFPYKGKDSLILEAMMPNRFLQSDYKEIIYLARRAVKDTKDAAEAAKRIEAFVAEYIENKGLSVGYATAAEVAASKQGDCTEFAVLTAAMCRAVGIPAQIVVGIAYVKNFAGLHDRFGGHAWIQAYIGGESGKWIGLDAAFKSAGLDGYGAGHIALATSNGEPAEFLNLASTLGHFKIDKVIIRTGQMDDR